MAPRDTLLVTASIGDLVEALIGVWDLGFRV